MTETEDTPIFERGDVVYGDDPFKGETEARPWLILSNHEGRPFHRRYEADAPTLEVGEEADN